MCLSFNPMAKEHVHALKGLACRKRVAAASSPAATCKQDAALASPARHACGCDRPSRARLCHRSSKFLSSMSKSKAHDGIAQRELNGKRPRRRKNDALLQETNTAVYLRFKPIGEKRMHALKGLACRKRVAVASSRRHLQAGCGAHVACATRLRLHKAFSRTLRSQKR